jgi:hypothetical protein
MSVVLIKKPSVKTDGLPKLMRKFNFYKGKTTTGASVNFIIAVKKLKPF